MASAGVATPSNERWRRDDTIVRRHPLEWIKNFDVFPKTIDDAKEVSVSGGSVRLTFGMLLPAKLLPSAHTCNILVLYAI